MGFPGLGGEAVSSSETLQQSTLWGIRISASVRSELMGVCYIAGEPRSKRVLGDLMERGMLDDIRVIEISTSWAASQAAWLLAESGADVIKLEPPGGDPARSESQYSVFNRSKCSVTVDLEDKAGAAELAGLLTGADVLIHDLTPARAKSLCLESHALIRYPKLVVGNITAMPAGHPMEEMPLVDSLVMAESGLLKFHDAINRLGPAFQRFPLGSQTSAYLCAVGVMARLCLRQRSGLAGSVSTSLLQGCMTVLMMLDSHPERGAQGFVLPPSSFNPLVQCSDGVWLHLMSPPDEAPLVKAELDRIGADAIARAVSENPKFNAHLPLFPLYGEIFAKRPSAEWLQDLWENDVAVEAAAPFGQLYFDEQAKQNNYVVEVDDAKWGRVLQPGSPILTTPASGLRWSCRSAGADTRNVLDNPRQGPQREPADGNASLPTQPLAGLKVLDLGNFLAGPLATMLMADLGADVIKLEATSGDAMRWVEWAFCGCSRGKRSIAADLKQETSAPILNKLVAWADVVHHNLRMSAATRLGLDYDSLKAVNPQLVYCHVSAYGALGPRRNWPGYDQMMQAASGWEMASAGSGNTPVWLRYGMMDHLCALSSVLATLLALYARGCNGDGQQVGASLLGSAVVTLGETMGLPRGEVLPTPPLDELQLGQAQTNRLYQCKDGWIAAFFASAGVYECWQRDLSAANPAEIEAALLSQTCQEVQALVASAGGYGVKVREAGDIKFVDDPELKRLGLAVSYVHPCYGEFKQAGALWNFEDMPAKYEKAAPTLGQHSTEILLECGFSNWEIEQFLSQGVVVETQRVK